MNPDHTGGAVGAIAVLFTAVCLYFLPAIIGRKKSNSSAIFWLTFLAGWTFVGWVVALVWALTRDSQPAQVIVNQTPTAAVLFSATDLFRFHRCFE